MAASSPSQSAPPASPDAQNPATLLCEACGYAVDGLDPSTPCPECAQPIADSLPDRRVGSPWEQSRTVRGAILTYLGIWFRPRQVFAIIRIDADRRRDLAARACIDASLLAMVPAAAAASVLVWLLLGPANMTFVAAAIWILAGTAGGSLIATMPWVVALLVLTRIEHAGIQFFGRTRGWRVTPQVADAVCAHAAAGWVGGALIGTALALLRHLLALLGLWRYESELEILAGPLVGLVVGLLWFECLVYVGVRRCRFANQDRRSRPGRTGAREALRGKLPA